jgi:hypothetical protein
VTWRGYTTNQRWLVGLEGGGTAFVKAAVNDDTAESLRIEHRMYATLSTDFMPSLVGWDGADPPVLVLEDLAGARWPPPWS